jgi:HD-GYP domain-containing protein (c-di-GMP phosphodiesterase class II)
MSAATHPRRSTSAAAPQAEFRCVPLAVFRLYRNISINLYTKSETQAEPVLYRSSSIPITEADLATLTERGHRALYIAAGDFAEFDAMLNDTLHSTLENGNFSREDRYSVLQAAAALELDVAFSMIRCDRFVEHTHRIAKQITTLLVGDEVVPRKMFDMLQHDFYTFTHITNVAGFATLLADGLGYTDPVIREQIAVGALLHDIGKRFIPTTVLNKTSRLSDDDWNLIRIHPQRGYEDLCDRGDVNEGQLLMVYSHHERIDGTGYPVGMVGDEIHPWARLLAVVDVFDAVTSARPYRVPMALPQALEFLQRNAGTHFDPEMVACWTSMMKKR